MCIRDSFYTVALAHWSACVWHLQTIIAIDLREFWVHKYEYCVLPPEEQNASVPYVPGYAEVRADRTYVAAPGGQQGWLCMEGSYLYVASLYWSMMTITSIGYGDIVATHGNLMEQVRASRTRARAHPAPELAHTSRVRLAASSRAPRSELACASAVPLPLTASARLPAARARSSSPRSSCSPTRSCGGA